MSASAPGSVPRSRAERPLRAIPRSRAYWELKAEQMMNRIFDPEEPTDLAVEPDRSPHQPAEPPAAAPQAIAAAPPAVASLLQLVPPPPGSEPPAAAASAPPVPGPAVPVGGTSPAGRVPGSARGPAVAPAAPGAARAGVVAAASPRLQRPSSRLSPPTASRGVLPARPRRPDERLVLTGALCGVCLASVAGSLLYFGHWTRLQQSLAQERNLLLLERLRSLGPANPSPVPGPQPAAPVLPAPATQSAAGAEGLPPPPPQEAWIEQLSTLPPPAPTPSRVLTVPVSPRLAASAPAAAATAARPSSTARVRAAAPLPQLVGVVVGAGRAPSAIFLVGGSSMSVGSGEPIGSSGWRLRSAEGETALIERGGELRQVSIASGNGF